LAKVVTVGLGHELCDRAWQLGLLTVYALTALAVAIRVKQERYIQAKKSEYQRLSELGLMPGTGFYRSGVKVTKQKGFGFFDVAGYWKRKYRNNGASSGWYLLTNVGSLKLAIASFKCRAGIQGKRI